MSLEYAFGEGVAEIHFDDGKANVMSTDWLRELGGLLDRAEKDEARAVLFRGRPGMFSGGLNMKWLPTLHARRRARARRDVLRHDAPRLVLSDPDGRRRDRTRRRRRLRADLGLRPALRGRRPVPHPDERGARRHGDADLGVGHLPLGVPGAAGERPPAPRAAVLAEGGLRLRRAPRPRRRRGRAPREGTRGRARARSAGRAALRGDEGAPAPRGRSSTRSSSSSRSDRARRSQRTGTSKYASG